MGRFFKFLVDSVVQTVTEVHRFKAVAKASQAATRRQYGMGAGGARGIETLHLGGAPAGHGIDVNAMQQEVEREAVAALCSEVTPEQILKKLVETMIAKIEGMGPAQKAEIVGQYYTGMEKMFGPGAGKKLMDQAAGKFGPGAELR